MRRSALMVTIVSLAIVFGLQSGPECSAQAKKDSLQRTKTNTGFGLLEGRWLRPDGDQ